MEKHLARRVLGLVAGLSALSGPAGWLGFAWGDGGGSVVIVASDSDEVPAATRDEGQVLRLVEPSSTATVVADSTASADYAQMPGGKLTVVPNSLRPYNRRPPIADSAVRPASSIEAVEGVRPLPYASWINSGGGERHAQGRSIQERLGGLTGAPAAAAIPRAGAERSGPAPGGSQLTIASAPPAMPADTAQAVHFEQVQQPSNVAAAARVKRSTRAPAKSSAKASAHASASRSTAKPNRSQPKNRQQDQPTSETTPADLLVKAHQLSLKASTESELSQVAKWCAAALEQGELDAESAAFATQLTGWALNRRGQLRADEGQADLALADFEAALAADANCWRALHNRAVTNAQAGKFAEAFDDLCTVIELNPKFAKAYSNRATLYVQAGDQEKAIADYDAAIQMDPKLVAALVGRGRVLHARGRLEQAALDLSAACELSPNNAEFICSRADLLADLGRYNEALEDYAKAIDLSPRLEHAYRNGAWLLATCPDDSIRDAEGALAGAKAALDCGYGERYAALDTMAAALANAGRFEEAVGTMQQAMEIAPAELREAYSARQQLYESGRPFRTHAVGHVAAAGFVEKR